MPANNKNSYIGPLILIGCLFFVFGFITWANSQLIPYLKIACELTDTQSYLVATAFFAAYFVMAIPSSFVLKKIGFHKGMSLGLLVMAVGAALFIPAAQSRSYPLFLTGLFIIGTGLALLQTAANPYVAVLGPIESAAQRISIMGICNKVAAILSVYILGGIVLKDVDALKAKLKSLPTTEKIDELNQLAERVIQPYIIIATAFAILAIAIYFVHLPEVHEEEMPDASVPAASTKSSVFQFQHLLLGVLALFFYVGVEVLSYDTFSSFGEFLGYKLETAAQFATYTGYCMVTGYLLGIFLVPQYISQRKALIYNCMLSIFLVFIAMVSSGIVAVSSFALLGFSNAIMWPAIWPLAINNLGKYTKIGAALLIMGIIGGAILPLVYGALSTALDSKQLGYVLMIPAYMYILYFATGGYKVGTEKIA